MHCISCQVLLNAIIFYMFSLSCTCQKVFQCSFIASSDGISHFQSNSTCSKTGDQIVSQRMFGKQFDTQSTRNLCPTYLPFFENPCSKLQPESIRTIALTKLAKYNQFMEESGMNEFHSKYTRHNCMLSYFRSARLS